MPLATLDRTPPAFFKQGPSAFTRLMFFSALAILLMVADARWKMTQPLRVVAATLLQPVQSVLLAPVRAWEMAGHYVAGVEEARALQARSQQQLAAQAERVTRMVQLERENEALRELLALRPRIEVDTLAAEVLYDARDPYTRKVVIDQGRSQGVTLGSPVIDERGVVGQVTRVYPATAEVTLVTDKDAAVPVVNVRTQHRGVAYGLPQTTGMELRFMAGNADVQAGDELQTSGLDGIYPAGVPVAKVVSVERRADSAFARIVLQPLAQPDSSRHVLLLQPMSARLPPRPEATDADAAAEAVSVSRSQP
ncbi:MAG: rod shape-determining protein MreC [Aquabacterium sp.]|jgi:rod shape-determining protein MreC|nr:rod shape-determining protein MreC [Aquabacterium sp.]MBP7502233.1 rod shape-determining protein MreC [Aquabacterium sp.]